MLEELRQKADDFAAETERKRRELAEAIRAGEVGDPFSAVAAIISIKTLIAVGVSAAVSIGTGLITRALTPRQKITAGDRGGQEFSVQRASQGAPIPEVWGADPGDRLGGGVKLAPIILWLSRTPDGYVARKHAQTSRTGGGGGKGFTKPKAPEVTTITYDLDVLLGWARGPLVLRKLFAATDVIYQSSSFPPVTYLADDPANTLFNAADVGEHVRMYILTGSVQFNNVQGAGPLTQLGVGWVASGMRSCQVWVNGVLATTLSLPGLNSSDRWSTTTINVPETATNVIKLVNTSSETGADIFLDMIQVGAQTVTGVPNTTIPPDEDYDGGAIPTPNLPTFIPTERLRGALLEDGTGGAAGTIQAGSYAGIATYEGNGTEFPDPVVEAAVDALYGAGSTPAYRHVATTRLSNFYLTRYQEAFPPFSGIWEHRDIHTLEDICAHLCERVGLTSDDYDFSDLSTVNVRGFVVTPPFTPKEVMSKLASLYNCHFYESDKIYGIRAESATTFSVDDSELGWTEEESEADVLSELKGSVPIETEVPRRVSVRYIDPARNYEENLQGEVRQVTTGNREDVLEVFAVMTADEAREAAQRELYQADVEAVTHSGTLSYEHIYRNPGDVMTVTRDEGFTHQIRLTSIKPGWVVEWEGVAIDTAIYTQPVSTAAGGFEPPPVAIPGQSLVGFYDGPLLRDEEMTENLGRGVYAGAVKRNGDGDFPGAALYLDRGLGPEYLENFEVEATFGVCATELADTTAISGQFTADALTVDLHNPDHTLESVTQEDLLKGANACIVGNEVCQILSATREPDTATYPNRWYLVIGRRALRGTDFATGSHAAGEAFVLLNDAVKFIPMNVSEVGKTRTYKMVTAGQSYDDAAAVTFTWTGASGKPLRPINFSKRKDSTDDTLGEFELRTLKMGPLREGRTADESRRLARLVFFTDGTYTTPLNREALTIKPHDELPLALVDESVTGSGTFTKNSITFPTTLTPKQAASLQLMPRSAYGNKLSAELETVYQLSGGFEAGGFAYMALIDALTDWRSQRVIRFAVEMVADAAGTAQVRIYEESAIPVLTLNGLPAKERWTMVVETGVVKFYRAGKADAPVYTSASAPVFPMRAFVRTKQGNAGGGIGRGDAAVNDAIMTSAPEMKFFYPSQQREADYGSTSATAYGLLFEVDEVFGKGHELPVEF